MTSLGKVLVFLNVIVATGLLAGSLSLFTLRVDWPNVEYRGRHKDEDPYRNKKLTALPGEIAKTIAERNAAYSTARNAVSNSEQLLADRSRKLAAKLQEARGGKFFELQQGPMPAGEKFNLDSAIQTKVAHKDNPAAELRGLEVLQDEVVKIAAAITGTDDQSNVPPAELAADPLKNLSGKKGLAAIRVKLAGLDTQVAALNNSIDRLRVAIVQREDEKRYLDDNQVNWDAQLITLQKRNEQLAERLKAFGVTRPLTAAPAAPTLAGGR